MGFAENFIRGHHIGTQERVAKQRQALDEQQFEEAKKQHADELKRQLESDKRVSSMAQLAGAEHLAQVLATTPGPQHAPTQGFGPTVTTPPEPIDISGALSALGISGPGQIQPQYLEATQAGQEAHARRLAQAAADVKSGPVEMGATTRKTLGLGSEPASPADVAVAMKNLEARHARELAGVKAANDPINVLLANLLHPGGAGGVHTGLENYSDTGAHTNMPYVDSTRLPTGKAGQALNLRANSAGIKVVNKDDASSLRDIATVGNGLTQLMDQLSSKLPKDATGRLIGAPSNKLAQYFQTDPELAAFNTFKDEAFRIVRAMGAGARMNEQQFKVAIANIPLITDTLGAAQQKAENLRLVLGGREAAILGIKIGQKRTFPNGTVAVWDGRGWDSDPAVVGKAK